MLEGQWKGTAEPCGRPAPFTLLYVQPANHEGKQKSIWRCIALHLVGVIFMSHPLAEKKTHTENSFLPNTTDPLWP